ncbi:hypothetical protein B0H12DRAFT_1015001 [Mycena haematopus]|nr:hypothetical protein B0H12DRAFT_1015001 [Mycena haematopus]
MTIEEGLDHFTSRCLTRHNLLGIRDVPKLAKIAITNVRVFNGEKLFPLGTVFIDGKHIIAYAEGAEVVDGNGGTLVPGLIDAHNHLVSVNDLEALALVLSTYDINTKFCISYYTASKQLGPTQSGPIMASHRHFNLISEYAKSLLGIRRDLINVHFQHFMNHVGIKTAKSVQFEPLCRVGTAFDADQATMNALVDAAHARNVCVACHAADYSAVDRALTAHADQAHHAPQDIPLDSALIARFVSVKASAPKIQCTKQHLQKAWKPPVDTDRVRCSVANISVNRLYQASVPILAGTDCIPGTDKYCHTLHNELENLVGAGLSTVDVLRSTTMLAAQHNLLFDRGVIALGMRADLLLISGDPIANISATRNIQRVWITGIEYCTVSINSNRTRNF